MSKQRVKISIGGVLRTFELTSVKLDRLLNGKKTKVLKFLKLKP